MKLFKIFFLTVCFFSFSQPILAAAGKSSYIGNEKTDTVKRKQIKIQACGQGRAIRYAGFVTNPPFGWVTVEKHNVAKNITYLVNNGYAYDLFNKMAKESNLKVENVGYKSYTTALRDLKRGRIDVLGGVYFNKMNLGVGMRLLYPSFMENPIVPLFVKGKEKEIKSFEDLKGLKGVIRKEELIYPMIYKQFGNIDLKQVSGSKKAFEMLMKGEADYLLTSLYSGEAEVRRFKLVDKIHFSNIALFKPQLFYAFSATSGCANLIPLFKRRLEKFQSNNSEYQKFFINYIDEWGQTFKDEAGLMEEATQESSLVLKNMDALAQKNQDTGAEIENNDK